MALLFSHVRVSAPDGNEAEFLVKGIPRDYDDLENYTAFEDFLDGIEEETEISVHAEAYLYGEGARLYNLKEVADFIHVMGGGYITEDDGTPLLEIKERDFVFCNDMRYKYALMKELRKGEGFEDRNWL